MDKRENKNQVSSTRKEHHARKLPADLGAGARKRKIVLINTVRGKRD